MKNASFSVDVDAIARTAAERAREIAFHAFAAAEFNKFDVVETIKYNLNRLNGLSLVTDEEKEKLAQLAALAASNADLSVAAHAIQDRSGASPMAVALAGIVSGVKSDKAAAAFSAALVGGLIQFGSNPERLSDENENGPAASVISVVAAIGAAAGFSVAAEIQTRRATS